MARKRLDAVSAEIDELRFEYVGLNSLHDGNCVAQEPAEVRLRIAARTRNRELADEVASLAMRLYWGPAGVSGMTSSVRRALRPVEAFLGRDLVQLETEVVEA
jgi:hypothetical protein